MSALDSDILSYSPYSPYTEELAGANKRRRGVRSRKRSRKHIPIHGGAKRHSAKRHSAKRRSVSRRSTKRRSAKRHSAKRSIINDIGGCGCGMATGGCGCGIVTGGRRRRRSAKRTKRTKRTNSKRRSIKNIMHLPSRLSKRSSKRRSIRRKTKHKPATKALIIKQCGGIKSKKLTQTPMVRKHRNAKRSAKRSAKRRSTRRRTHRVQSMRGGGADIFGGNQNIIMLKLYNDYKVFGSEDRPDIKITNKAFTDKGGFIMYYDPACPHCVRMGPIMSKLADKVKGSIAVGGIDCSDVASGNELLAEFYNISGYPTIKFFNEVTGEYIDYEGGRTVEDLLSFLCRVKYICKK